MSPFYWHEGIPEHEGWYLCAWQIHNRYIYDVGKWNGQEWFTHMTAEPQLFHKIVDPNEFFAELDAQAEAYQRDQIEREVRQKKPETHNSLPFLGAN